MYAFRSDQNSIHAASRTNKSAAGIGIVIVSQGSLAESLREGLEHMIGPQKGMRTVTLGQCDTLTSATAYVRDAVAEVSSGQGVIILADIFGGTPCNAAMRAYEADAVEVIAGVNLPLLVKLARVRNKVTLSEALEAAHSAGHRYLISCGDHIGYTLS